MKRTRTWKFTSLFMAVVLMAMLALGACSSQPASSVAGSEAGSAQAPASTTEQTGKKDLKDVKIGVTLVNIVEPFFADIKSSLEAEAAAQGIGRIDIQDGQNDPAKQLAQVEDFIAQGFDIIVINPVEAQSLVSAAEACNRAGIPVFTIDRRLESGCCMSRFGKSPRASPRWSPAAASGSPSSSWSARKSLWRRGWKSCKRKAARMMW